MIFCKDCKHFIDETPLAPKGWLRFFIPQRWSADACYQFCDVESGRNLVTGKINYADLERITGECGEDGKLFIQR